MLLIGFLWGCGGSAPEHDKAAAVDGSIRLNRSTVGDGAVHFFTYEYDGKNVNFLIRTDGDGRLHSHLDACYSCYQYKRGFVVEGSDVVCIACRLKYPIEDEFWDFIGACAPIPIHHEVTADTVVIEARLLEQAARYF
jgi:uncharacterized membrane protein